MDSVKELSSSTNVRNRSETKTTTSPSSSSSPDSSSSAAMPDTSASPGSHKPITSSSSPITSVPSSTSVCVDPAVSQSHSTSSLASAAANAGPNTNNAFPCQPSASESFPGEQSGSSHYESVTSMRHQSSDGPSDGHQAVDSYCKASGSQWTGSAGSSEERSEERKAETTFSSSESRGHNKKKPGQGLAADVCCSSSSGSAAASASSASKAASPSSSDAGSRKDSTSGRKHRHHHHSRSRRGSSSPSPVKKMRSGSVGANSSSEKGSAQNSASDSEDEHRMMIDEDAANEEDVPVSHSSPTSGQVADSFSSITGSPDASSSPKVPPLRIVISKSNSIPNPGNVTSADQAHSFPQRVTSSTSTSSSASAGKSHLLVSSSATLSSISSNQNHNNSSSSNNNGSSSNREDQDAGASDDEASNASGTSGPANADSKSGSASARVTRSSQRVKELHHQHHQDPHSARSSHHNLRDRGRDKDTDESDSQVTSPTSTSAKETRDESSLSGAANPSSGKTEAGTRKRKVARTKASSSTAAAAASGSSATPEKVTRSSEKNLRDSVRNKDCVPGESSHVDEDNESTSSSTSSASGSKESVNDSAGLLKTKEFSVPSYNSYQMYLNIRKAIGKRRKNLLPVQPNPPKGFNDYLMIKGGYLLKDSMSANSPAPTSILSARIPGLASPPADLSPGSALYNLFVSQEGERHRLRIQHTIEKEKLRLSYEQEILRVHGRAALAVANQTIPYSFCSIIKDDEIYNMIEQENEDDVHDEKSETSSDARPVSASGSSSGRGNDYTKNTYTNSSSTSTDLTALTGGPSAPGSRSRYNGRLFLSWIQDVTEKWDKIKTDTILRQRRESESLLAIQKLDWEWKMKELLLCDFKTTPLIDRKLIPSVDVCDDFDLLPSASLV